jgi:NADPH-dependent glutamate synthase beta subunit-like oxidoreductase
MSFRMLEEQVIEAGLCQGCGLCAGLCKHIELKDLKPRLVDYCIVEKEGLKCGKCYENCPQVRQEAFKKRSPIEILSLRATDASIRKNAASGGFVTAFNKYILENNIVEQIIEVKKENDIPKAVVTKNSNDVLQYAGLAWGRSGTLQRLVDALGKPHGKIAVVGVPCEIRGAAEVERTMKVPLLKIGLFCNANIRTELTDQDKIFSPCASNCPAGVNARGYIDLIKKGKFSEAVQLIRETNPLPSICGRICTHECEYGCTLIGTNHPIAIRELKKFVTEWEMSHGIKIPTPEAEPKHKKVAIIGSGPAGLTAAYYLANLGYKPTIFEKSDKAGGMLRFGVPKFRLPDEVLDYDIETIKSFGAEIKLNTPIGPNLTLEDLKKQGFEAIFISIGQYAPLTLKIEGENNPGVYVAIEFLMHRKYRYWENQEEFKGKTLYIIGGGPVAVDVAQTALRLGAKKIYLAEIRDEKALKMVIEEIPKNEFKFMEYLYETSTNKITKNENGTLKIHGHKVKAELDASGKMNFKKTEGSEFTLDVDNVVIAIGQSVDYSLLDAAGGDKLKKNRGKIVVDELTFETNIPGVFAGGDIIERGKNVAVAAIAHGREAAISIDRYLRGEDLRKGRLNRSKMFFTGPLSAPKDVSIKPPSLVDATEDLWMNFKEIEGKFTEEMAINEAKRCLNCNNFCSHCQDFPAIFADVTAGEVGSEKGYTTVLVWNKKTQEIIHKMIESGLLEKGQVSQEAVDKAIDRKMKRELLEFELAPREKVYKYIMLNGPSRISKISEEIGMSPKDVRFHALRLSQIKRLQMIMNESDQEPIFEIPTE